ncbi:AAA family ATPase [Candidatus Kaiserbacteria bacterium]|nr:AAA family ATPase [Candidatus Kaiserbacteria bacterium]
MYLKGIELSGFKSFAKKSELSFASPIAGIVGPNGSGKSNIAEAFRFVLGEQSFKSMRGKRGEDLMWGGSQSAPRANRASVKATFNNFPVGESRLFDIDFDEVVIERVVYRDGINDYLINGTRVRLKDIVELLAHANIGSTGHHIISQGEADVLLSASIRERREMIEDALGLKIFQYKKKESQRKLEHTAENVAHVASLRKEIAPHVRFLKKQVEKLEKSERLRGELKKLLREYLKREELYITYTRKDIESKREKPRTALLQLENELKKARAVLEKATTPNNRGKEILDAEKKLSLIRSEREELSREIGRLEGQISFAEKHPTRSREVGIPLSDARALAGDIERALDEAERSAAISAVKEGFKKIRTLLVSFIHKYSQEGTSREDTAPVEKLKAEKSGLDVRFRDVEEKEKETARVYKKLQEEIELSKDEGRDAERDVFRITTEKSKVEGVLDGLLRDEKILRHVEEEFRRDMEEGAALAGRDILGYSSVGIANEEVLQEAREKQEERRRAIEKIKIRVEEFGGGSGDDVLKEYQEVHERDQFLEKEVADLERSAETLKRLIAELDEKLAVKFEEGVKKINKEFQHFFALLFGGGTASLKVFEQKKEKHTDFEIEEQGDETLSENGNEEVETGIDILVSLPRKKIKGLQMLSGGERALTSIALLFAMSQVNPPPFLVLDETDAALDEANSRKYSAMVKDLAKKTQLILITHNRETMSIAGVLYGVTMGSDGMSKLLSVKFEEAVQVAK